VPEAYVADGVAVSLVAPVQEYDGADAAADAKEPVAVPWQFHRDRWLLAVSTAPLLRKPSRSAGPCRLWHQRSPPTLPISRLPI